MNKASKIIISIGVIFIAGALALAFWQYGKSNETLGKYDNLAKCLANKQITMYGAYWCPHCQNEKKGFGSSWQYVPYVECTKETKLCLEKGIDGYPTWIFPDGKKLVGEQGLQKLSQESDCAL